MTKLNVPNMRGKLLFDEPLSRYNTWGVGGRAECVFVPADIEDLSNFLANTNQQIPITWLGLGSNVLVRDGGIEGVVIITQRGLKDISFKKHSVYAQAGTACAKLARASVSKHFTGIEFLAGIPGTIGGALAMNAGAFGGQTWEHVIKVDTINRHGELISRDASEFEYGYRYAKSFAGEWFVGAEFKLETTANTENVVSIKDLLEQRASSQPIGKKNCGSVFKNPEQGFAAQLIEQCGLKGYTIGGACVSEKHANFIINESDATAHDIEQLIFYVQQKVLRECHIELIPEVRFMGKAK